MQRIKELTKKIAATYQTVVAASTPKKSNAAAPTDRLDALRQLHNLRSNRSKWAKKLENAPDPAARLKAEKKLKELAERKNSLESYLKEAEAKVDADSPTT